MSLSWLVSQRARLAWPARSHDLSPLDFFLWGFLKGKVYQSQPSNISELKESIKHVLADVTPELCRVIANMRQRMKLCMQTGGGHFEHLL